MKTIQEIIDSLSPVDPKEDAFRAGKKKMSVTNRGRKFSEESRKKMSAAQQARDWNLSEETRKKISDAHRGKLANKDTRKKMSDSQKQRIKKHGQTEAERTAWVLKSAEVRRRRCTVDGITIYSGVRELIAALGQGKNGSRSPNFRYVD